MDSRRLRHFLAVFEHGSLGRAAEELHLTQPALSKSIHQLEEELNVKLFERTPAGVVPTIYGEALSLHAKVIEAEMHNAEREIATLSGAAKGEITVGVTPSIAANVMPRTALQLRAERPGIRVKVWEGLVEQHVPALRRGELDVVVGGWARGMHPDLTTEVIVHDTVRVFGGADHPLTGEPVSPSTLCEYPWAMPPHTQFWLDLFERVFVSQGLSPPTPDAVTNSASFIKEMLLGNEYLSFLPSHLLARETKAGHIVPIHAEGVSVDIDIMATYRERAVHPSAFNAFMATLKNVCETPH